MKEDNGFFSLVDEETRRKELSTHPVSLKNRKLFGKRSWKKRRARQRQRERAREPSREYRLTLEGKYNNLRVLYNWRHKKSQEYDKKGDVSVFFPKRKDYIEEQHKYPMDVPPRWYSQNNQFLLSLDEYMEAWYLLNKHMGYEHQDRGLGKDDSSYTWKPEALVGRRSYGSLKFGRKDRMLPFQWGNIEFYIPLSKKEREELRNNSSVWFAPLGAYYVVEACPEKLPDLEEEGGEKEPPLTIRIDRGYVESMGKSVYENVPIRGKLFMYGNRLVIFRT